jgi:hypothetical protein
MGVGGRRKRSNDDARPRATNLLGKPRTAAWAARPTRFPSQAFIAQPSPGDTRVMVGRRTPTTRSSPRAGRGLSIIAVSSAMDVWAG